MLIFHPMYSRIHRGRAARRLFAFALFGMMFVLVQCPNPASGPKSYVYVSNATSNDVSAFVLDLDNGTLTAANGSPFPVGAASSPNAVAANPAGTLVFVAEYGPGKVGVFSVGAGGSLTEVANSPFASGANTYDVRVDPSGRWLYAANDGAANVSGFSIDAATGALSGLSNSPYGAGNDPSYTAVAPSGQFAYVANEADGTVSGYSVTNGVLSSLGSAAPLLASNTGSTFPYAVVVDPSGKYLYSANSGTDGVSALSINGAGGLSIVTNSPFSSGTGSSPYSLAIDPKGRFLYVADSGTASVSAFTIAASGPSAGQLTAIPGSPFAAGTSPDVVAVDPTSTYLLAGNSQSNNLSMYTITQSGPNAGALTQVQGSPFMTGTNPNGIAITPPK